MLFREQPTTNGWDKEIVRYTMAHEDAVRKVIQHTLARSPQVTSNDTIDEIMAEMYKKLYTISDFNQDTAALLSEKNRKRITLESYVGTIAKRCAQSHIAKLYEDNRASANKEIYVNEDETLDIMDILSDNKAEIDYNRSTCVLDSQLKLMEPYRYAYGMDFFLYLYIRLHGLEENKSQSILELFSIFPCHVTTLHNGVKNSTKVKNRIQELAAASNMLAILGKYIYNKDGVDRVIQHIKYC